MIFSEKQLRSKRDIELINSIIKDHFKSLVRIGEHNQMKKSVDHKKSQKLSYQGRKPTEVDHGNSSYG
jgi:hypothetical protein